MTCLFFAQKALLNQSQSKFEAIYFLSALDMIFCHYSNDMQHQQPFGHVRMTQLHLKLMSRRWLKEKANISWNKFLNFRFYILRKIININCKNQLLHLLQFWCMSFLKGLRMRSVFSLNLYYLKIQTVMIKNKKTQVTEKNKIQLDLAQSQSSYNPDEQQQQTGGQSVKVALRLRPMNNNESQRGDTSIFKVVDKQNCQLLQKNGQIFKNFRFNYVLEQKSSQSDVYNSLRVDDFLQQALNGYSVTIFAYGQTGSGKTYTMAGVQQKFSQQVFQSDDSDGIIPRAIKNLWKYSQNKKDKYSVKASFTQIYNQQIRDLLNPGSGVLHCRWNAANGFFVQDLVIVDCTSIDDLIAVLNEGIKNRKSGSHQLNQDSSRSHSLMTVYVISQTQSVDNRSVKRYGKISFVDLAGSERLKQSKSQGEMAKQTANINKSLFTLGKVIKALSDKKNKVPYIPYRDSKLTMLLMDSLGGSSKALMVACVSPASVYFDQTLSTLNYATRTMNIKNKPVVQMQEKDQIIYGLMRQRDLLRLENQYLREQIQKATNGSKIPKLDQKKKNLPPLSKGTKEASQRPISLQKSSPPPEKKTQLTQSITIKNSSMKREQNRAQIQISLNKIVQQYEFEMLRLENENNQLKNARQIAEKNYLIVTNDNNALQIKLDNLQQLFIKNTHGKKNINQEYMNSNLIAENKMIRDKISQLEDEIFELKEVKMKKNIKQSMAMSIQEKEVRVTNKNLKDRVEFLRNRQMQLTNLINKKDFKK